MGEIAIVDDISLYCPIFNEIISESYCYDINSVAFGFCSPDLVEKVIDRESSEPICTDCENKQM